MQAEITTTISYDVPDGYTFDGAVIKRATIVHSKSIAANTTVRGILFNEDGGRIVEIDLFDYAAGTAFDDMLDRPENTNHVFMVLSDQTKDDINNVTTVALYEMAKFLNEKIIRDGLVMFDPAFTPKTLESSFADMLDDIEAIFGGKFTVVDVEIGDDMDPVSTKEFEDSIKSHDED